MEKVSTEMIVVKAEPPAVAEVITVDVDQEALNCPRCLHALAPPVFQCAGVHVVHSTCHGKTIIKVEQQQADHGESKSAAVKVIVDPEALDCPRCLYPLVPLVYKCAAGHVVCSSCHNKCASCFIKTGYTCCHGVERALQSNRPACPNAIHGCTGSGSIAERVVKMGPCGGGGGDPWEMDMRVNRIVQLNLWHDIMVDTMMVLYELDDGLAQIKLWGSPQAANCSEIRLEQDEYLTGVKGYVADCKGWLRLRSLTLLSNQRTFGPYGTEEGAPFELPAAGGRIIGFHGRSGTFLDALGTYVKMDA